MCHCRDAHACTHAAASATVHTNYRFEPRDTDSMQHCYENNESKLIKMPRPIAARAANDGGECLHTL